MDLRKKCRRPRSRSNVEKNEVKALAATNKRWHCKINCLEGKVGKLGRLEILSCYLSHIA